MVATIFVLRISRKIVVYFRKDDKKINSSRRRKSANSIPSKKPKKRKICNNKSTTTKTARSTPLRIATKKSEALSLFPCIISAPKKKTNVPKEAIPKKEDKKNVKRAIKLCAPNGSRLVKEV